MRRFATIWPDREKVQPLSAQIGWTHHQVLIDAFGDDRNLYAWAAAVSVLAGVLVTAFSAVPARLPGIALDSTPLFLVERGGAVVAALIVVTGRTRAAAPSRRGSQGRLALVRPCAVSASSLV